MEDPEHEKEEEGEFRGTFPLLLARESYQSKSLGHSMIYSTLFVS